MFYLVCKNSDLRNNLIQYLKENGTLVVFNYLPLHSSPFYDAKYDSRELPNCDNYSDYLVEATNLLIID
jgi:dTDP-4-amino-4,6-dideoxygalactose transaminase